MERDAAAGSRRARSTSAALQRLSFQLSGAQLGITVTSLVVGFIAEPTVAAAIEPLIGQVVSERHVRGVAIGVALVLATVVSMVIGELIPKSLAIARPRVVAYAVVPPMILVNRILGPLISFLNGAANATVRRLGIEPREELTSVRSLEELELLIRSSGEEGTLERSSLTMLTRAIRFGTKDAADALVPRRSVKLVGIDDTVSTLAELAVTTGHSRFPVVGADLDDVRGVVHVKDVYRVAFAQRGSTSVAELMAPPFVVPETRGLGELMVDLRAVGTHLAVVVDEHGGTAGIITLEDVLEEIVGEIDDEHDRPTTVLTALVRPGAWQVDGSLHPDEVFDTCGLLIPDGDYETLAGFVLQRFGHIPVVGERFDHGDWEILVVALEGHRVATVEIRRRSGGAIGEIESL